ncbi:MAG: glycosyltransferase family 4 protein [Actinomycetota bacterium]
MHGDDHDTTKGGKPRILLVTDRVPGHTSGYGIRVANVIEGLVAVGDLHVCLIDSSFHGAERPTDERYETTMVSASELPRWRRGVQRVWTIPNLSYADDDAVRSRIAASVGDREWDLVWFSRARVHRLCAELFPTTRILDLDDLNDRLLRSLARERIARRGPATLPQSLSDLLLARRWRRYHRSLDRLEDRLVVTNEIDRAHLGASRADVVVNGYPPVPPLLGRVATEARLLFVGPMHYEPNYLAVCWLAYEVLDLIRAEVPDARLSVAGDLRGAPTPPHHEAVDYHGFVPDLTDHYAGAAVAVAPLNAGGGTRVKVLEALARCRPLVATPFAVEGLDLAADRELLVSDDPEVFAEHCIGLLRDPAGGRRMAEAGLAAYRDRYTSDHASGQVTDLVCSIVDCDRRRVAPPAR